MIDTEAYVYSALIADATLIALLGGNSIYNLATDKGNIFPRVVFSKYLEGDDAFADDVETNCHVYIQTDIINQGKDVEDVANEVENVMNSLYFRHGSSTKIVTDNDKTKIIEKHITWTILVELED